MKADSFDTILNFEEAFEAAATAVIAASDVLAVKAREKTAVAEFQAACVFDVGGANADSRQIIGTDASGRPVIEYGRYDGCTLEIQIIGNRFSDDGSDIPGVSTKLAEMRAKVRRIFRESQWPLNDDNLKYYRVSRLRPSGTQNGVTEGKERDVTTLRFMVDFVIMPDAWPDVA